MSMSKKFVAHRGLQHRYPENSLLAIEAAITAGLEFVELDVQFSADLIPVIYHDDNLQRMSAMPGKVHDFSYQQLSRFPAHEPLRFGDQFLHCHISALQDLIPVIESAPQVHFFVELKPEATAILGSETCVQLLQPLLQPVMSQITLISYDAEALRLAKQQYGFTRTGIILSDWSSRNQVIANTLSDVAFINKERIPAGDSIDSACPIAIYEIDTVDEARDMLARGAALLESFQSDLLANALTDILPA